jgi:hypothetical protein
VPSIAYLRAGINLWTIPYQENTQLNWFEGHGYSASFGPRNVIALYWFIEDLGTIHTLGEENLPELGDIVISPNMDHSGLIVYVGDDLSSTLVAQASYSQGIINVMPLDEWAEAMCSNSNNPCSPNDVSYGHPNVAGGN